MKKKPKVLLFDLDGTLVRTGGAGIRALERSFKILYNIEKTVIDGINIAGNTDPNIFREILAREIPGKIATPEEENIFFDHYLKFLAEEIQSSPGYKVLPGIKKILETATTQPDLHVGLGTGNLRRGAHIKLERGGLNPYFSFGGFGSDSTNRQEVLTIAVKRAEEVSGIRFLPEQVFIIGDTPRDVRAARAIHAKVICVATGGYSYEELGKLEPDLLVENFRDGNVERFFEFLSL